MGIEFWDDIPSVRKQLESVRQIISHEIDISSQSIRETLSELINSSGKLLRPGFFLISSGFGEMEEEKKLNMAASIELLHIATLIHDDIIDDSDTRRGVPAVHAVHGKKRAVLAGDFLFTRCFALVSGYARSENIKLLSDALSEICKSEILQSQALFDKSSTMMDYLRKIRGKTAALFSLSFYMGAFEAGCNATLLRSLKYAGYYTGIAFQLIDDLLDYESFNTGKPVFKDIQEGNFTLPVIYALKNEAGSLYKILKKKKYGRRDLGMIYDMIKSSGGIKRTRELAGKYSVKALFEMDKIPENENRKMMKTMIDKLLSRNY
jgi:heptaprenyl diphosphate synthase